MGIEGIEHLKPQNVWDIDVPEPSGGTRKLFSRRGRIQNQDPEVKDLRHILAAVVEIIEEVGGRVVIDVDDLTRKPKDITIDYDANRRKVIIATKKE